MSDFGFQRQSNAFSYGPFVHWIGVVEDRMDPKKLGRVRVRVFGYHTEDKSEISTENLFWAMPIQAITSAALSGVGHSPTGILEGTTVFGYFADGHNAQHPIILGTLGGVPGSPDPSKGFNDPNNKYPKFPGEADTNRLARNEKIEDTIVKTKRDNLDEADVAFGGQWKEKATQYNAQYPFNHVYESESGHITEFDDTEDYQRYHRYHRAGTFEEIHPDGTQVEKIVKDNYQIVLGENFVHIKGNCTVTIDGNSSLLIKGNANIEVNGNVREHIHGNYDLTVDGNYNVTVNGNEKHTIGGNHQLEIGGSQLSKTVGLEKREAALIMLN